MTQLILPVRSPSGRGPDAVALRVTTDRVRRWLALMEDLTRRNLHSVRLYARPATLRRATCSTPLPDLEPLLAGDDVRTHSEGTAHHAGVVVRQTGVHVHAYVDADETTDDAYQSIQLSQAALRTLLNQLLSRADGTDIIVAFDEVELTEDVRAHGQLLLPRGTVCTVRVLHHEALFGVSDSRDPDGPVLAVERRGLVLLLQDDEQPNLPDPDEDDDE